MDLTRFVQYIFGFIALTQVFMIVSSVGAGFIFTPSGQLSFNVLAANVGVLLLSIVCIFLLQRYHEHLHGKQGSSADAQKLVKKGIKAVVIVAIAGVLFVLALLGMFLYAFI